MKGEPQSERGRTSVHWRLERADTCGRSRAGKEPAFGLATHDALFGWCSLQNRDVGERFGPGRTPLFDSPTEDVAEAFDRSVDRSVDVRSCHSNPDRSRRLQSNRYDAGHPIARIAVAART